MNYEKLIQSLSKNRRLQIFLVTSALIAFFVIQSNLKAPTNNSNKLANVDSLTQSIKAPQSNKLDEQITQTKIRASENVEFSQIPNFLDVYYYVNPEFNENDAYKLLDKLKLSNVKTLTNETLGQVLSSKNGNINMTVYIDKKRVDFSDQSSFSKKGMTKEIDFYKNSAEVFMKNSGLKMDGYEFSTYGFFAGNSTELEYTRNKFDAVLVKLIYKHSYDGKSIIPQDDKPYGNYTSIWLTDSGKVVKFTYEYAGAVGEKLGNVKLKSQDQILNDIKLGRVKFVSATFDDQNLVKELIIDKVEISYYAKDNKLQPILFLTGTVKTDKEDASGYLVMDAIETDEKN